MYKQNSGNAVSFFALHEERRPLFNVDEFSGAFDTDILRSISSDQWLRHSSDITRLNVYATKVSTMTLGADGEVISAEQRDLLSYLLAHSAWAVHAKERKAGFAKAEELIGLGKLLVSPENNMAQGYLKYVHSAIYRGNDKFVEALDFADEAIEHFREVPEIGSVIAHAYNQGGLAAFRLPESDPRRIGSLHYYKTAMGVLDHTTPRPCLIKFDACRLLSDAEGDPRARTLMNLTQYHLSVKNFGDALQSIEASDACSPPKTSLETAYRGIVKGECYLGVENYGDALTVFLGSCEIYTSESMTNNQNYLRGALGVVAVCSSLIEAGHTEHVDVALQYMEEAIKAHATLNLSPEHDFSIRLSALSVICGGLHHGVGASI